jgi:hypothetical protein
MAGSIRKLSLDGVTFNVAADSNFKINPRTKKEGVPHSGGNEIKETTDVAQVDGGTIIANDNEYSKLLTIQKKSQINMSFIKNDGSVYVSQGTFSIEGYESEENRVELVLIPITGEWTLFSA